MPVESQYLPIGPSAAEMRSAIFQRVNPLEEAEWDARLTTCPSASFFHTTAWARVLQSSYGYTPVYFILSEGGSLRSLLPMMEVNSWLTGRRGISLPFTDDSEPVGSDVDSLSRVFQEAMRYAEERDWKYLECRGGKTLLPDMLASTSFYGHQLNLIGGEEVLFAKMKGTARSAIRKAEKSDVQLEISQSLETIRIFYGLLCKTRKRHGVPPQPWSFFQNIHTHVLLQNKGFVVLARHQQAPIAAAIFFHFGGKAIYKYSASDETFKHLPANNLVMWEAIKWYAQHGFEQLDFGRTSLENEGLRKFKLAWGTEERMIEYVKYDRRQHRFVTARDESSGWHNRVFRALPLPLSRFIGAVLYKHVA